MQLHALTLAARSYALLQQIIWLIKMLANVSDVKLVAENRLWEWEWKHGIETSYLSICEHIVCIVLLVQWLKGSLVPSPAQLSIAFSIFVCMWGRAL